MQVVEYSGALAVLPELITPHPPLMLMWKVSVHFASLEHFLFTADEASEQRCAALLLLILLAERCRSISRMDGYENGSHVVAWWKLAAAVVQHVYRGQVPQPHYFSPHGLFLWETGKWTPISSSPAAAPYLCG